MIDQKLLKRTLENRFTLKYTTKAEIEKISKANFILFLFWLDKDNLTFEHGHYRFSKNKKITIYEEMGYDHYTGDNYPPIYFLECFMGFSFRQALYLLKHFYYKVSRQIVERELYATFGTTKTSDTEQPKADLQYILKENLLNHIDQDKRNTAFKRLYGYLTQRGLERFVIQNMVSQNWLIMNENYNMCFITYENIETKDKVIGITQKGTLTGNDFKQNNTSDRHTGFLYAPKNTTAPDTLFIFESCLDLFSFQQLIWLNKIKAPENHISISLNGCSNRKYIYKTLNQYPSIKNVFVCLDNDEAGIKSTKIIQRQLLFKIYDLRPVLRDLTALNGYRLIKDWNEALKLTDKINIDLNTYLE